jgi:hypothetical protein
LIKQQNKKNKKKKKRLLQTDGMLARNLSSFKLNVVDTVLQEIKT